MCKRGLPPPLFDCRFEVGKNIPAGIPLALVIGITFLAFCTFINIPLLHDAYTDVALAAHESLAQVLGTFYQHPVSGDFFFRPVGNLTYWIDFKWSGFDPFRWHLWNLLMHLLNSWLVYALMRQLRFAQFPAAISALLFGLHGTRPEVVSWVGERFDLLSAFFVLVSMVALNRYLDTPHRRWYWLMIASCVLGLMSKEAAYCLPFLVLALIPFKPESKAKIIRAVMTLTATCAVMFAYHYWVIGSIGGYKTSGGESTIGRFNPVHSINALLFRQWAILFFPINWSAGVGLWVKLAILMVILVLLAALVWCRPAVRLLAASIFIVIAASSPIQHLLLISKEMTGARVLYLPAVGMSILFGVLIQSCTRRSIAMALGVGILAAQFAFLEHNLSIWRQAAFLSQKSCRDLGEQIARTGGRSVVEGVPATWHGVWFLRNGFASCVAMNSGVPPENVQLVTDDRAASPGKTVYVWNAVREDFENRF